MPDTIADSRSPSSPGKAPTTMNVVSCGKTEYDYILSHFDEFWPVRSDPERTHRLRAMHHPLFIYELGDNAFAMKMGDRVAGYLWGVFSRTEPVAYVQFVATHGDFTRQGVASRLYAHFEAKAKRNGCRALKAITSPHNTSSIRFHQSLGMGLLGEPNEAGVPVLKDYAGPHQDRVVFWKSLA